MRKDFRTFNLAVTFYHLTESVPVTGDLKDQLRRAAASIALNLAEGSGRASKKEQKRFFTIAFGSLRECQAVLDLCRTASTEVIECADKLAAHLYKLIRSICV